MHPVVYIQNGLSERNWNVCLEPWLVSHNLHAALNQKRNISAIVEQSLGMWNVCLYSIDFDLCMKQKKNNNNNKKERRRREKSIFSRTIFLTLWKVAELTVKHVSVGSRYTNAHMQGCINYFALACMCLQGTEAED